MSEVKQLELFNEEQQKKEISTIDQLFKDIASVPNLEQNWIFTLNFHTLVFTTQNL